jgi:SET domain-containing protein
MTKQKQKFVVKRTVTGLGLFTQEHIRAKKRIIEYLGTVITNEEAQKKGGKYLFELDDQYSLDGSVRTNLARYINHACEPNSEAYIYGHRIWIYSIVAIAAGEAITLDYGESYFAEHIAPKGCKCVKCSPRS